MAATSTSGPRAVSATSQRRALLAGAVLVAVAALARGIFLAGFFPPMHGPDEDVHFDYVQALAEHGHLPRASPGCSVFSPEVNLLDRQLLDGVAFHPEEPLPPLASLALPDGRDFAQRSTTGCGPAATYPPLAYASAVPFYAAARDGPLLVRTLAVRLASALWGVAGALLAVALGFIFTRSAGDALLLGLLTVAQPMVGFLSAVASPDAALFALSTGSFACIAALHRRPGSSRALAALALTATAGVLVKPTFMLFLPVYAAGCAAALGLRRARLRRTVGLTGLAMALPAATALLWSAFIRSAAALQLAPEGSPEGLGHLLRRLLEPDRLTWIWHRMYWMVWGWADTRLRPGYYQALGLTVCLAAGGLVLGWRTLAREERGLVLFGLAATAYGLAALHGLELLVVRRTGGLFVQGRYLLPLFPVHAGMLVVGLRALARRFGAAVDPGWALAGTLVLVDAASFLRVLVRSYG